MSEEENYIIENETQDTKKKQEYWNTGIGLNKVDNLEPSKYLIDLSKKNINGKLKYSEVENLLKTYYETQNQNDADDAESGIWYRDILKTASLASSASLSSHKNSAGVWGTPQKCACG